MTGRAKSPLLRAVLLAALGCLLDGCAGPNEEGEQDRSAAEATRLSREIRGLIERLGSERIEEREEAAGNLCELGRVAIPALEEASRGSDHESALRAKQLLDEIAEPQPGEEDLVLRLTKEGLCTRFEKVFANFGKASGDPEKHQRLEDVFESRRQRKQSGGREEPLGGLMAYTLFVEADADAPFRFAQMIWKLAVKHGGVQKMVLAVPELQEFARLSFLPEGPEAKGVRLLVHAASGSDPQRPRSFRVSIGDIDVGELVTDESGRSAGAQNRAVISLAMARVRDGLNDGPPAGRLILQVDGSFPVRHVIRLLANLYRRGVRGIDVIGVTIAR